MGTPGAARVAFGIDFDMSKPNGFFLDIDDFGVPKPAVELLLLDPSAELRDGIDLARGAVRVAERWSAESAIVLAVMAEDCEN